MPIVAGMNEKSDDAADGVLTPGQTATGAGTSDLGADGNPFEQGTGDPVGAGTVETPNVDGGRPDAQPEALIEGNRVTTAADMQGSDPVDAARQSKETVTNDAVAGETVLDGAGDGNYGPTGGSPREAEPVGDNELDDDETDLGTDIRDVNER